MSAFGHEWSRSKRKEPRGHTGKEYLLQGWVCQKCGREVMTHRFRADGPTYRQLRERKIRNCDQEIFGSVHES